MAPVSGSETLLRKRQYYDNCDSNNYSCYSTWNSWGRWVALIIIVVAAISLACLLSCINSRRRRRQGRAPMYGTGWMPYHNTPVTHNKPPGYADPNNPPPPPYVGGQATGTTFNSNNGYYGNHGATSPGEYELQQPSSSYQPQRGGDPVYDAPVGPPPSKGRWGTNDQVIR